ncbi:Dedicator of cytokinesis [Carpediemonas membranifera]|uniref:Dedicator of cytokinesis n=1 Tax=Carpediemonas membranifera TaxID=201153 RepID=A0A8J6AUQ1_9EUKA|nr:Dedicator of cytokinesis [Carpediemonas membranifera]|eukprot:KAG9392960.1 Dedicator of cytokinesis [Carpediemonas membranifera]
MANKVESQLLDDSLRVSRDWHRIMRQYHAQRRAEDAATVQKQLLNLYFQRRDIIACNSEEKRQELLAALSEYLDACGSSMGLDVVPRRMIGINQVSAQIGNTSPAYLQLLHIMMTRDASISGRWGMLLDRVPGSSRSHQALVIHIPSIPANDPAASHFQLLVHLATADGPITEKLIADFDKDGRNANGGFRGAFLHIPGEFLRRAPRAADVHIVFELITVVEISRLGPNGDTVVQTYRQPRATGVYHLGDLVLTQIMTTGRDSVVFEGSMVLVVHGLRAGNWPVLLLTPNEDEDVQSLSVAFQLRAYSMANFFADAPRLLGIGDRFIGAVGRYLSPVPELDRSDVYITLSHGSFMNNKNYEVIIRPMVGHRVLGGIALGRAVGDNPCAALSDAGLVEGEMTAELQRSFLGLQDCSRRRCAVSRVFYHEQNPQFNDTFILPIERTDDVSLHVTVANWSRKRFRREVWAHGVLPLFRKHAANGTPTVVHTGPRTLKLHRTRDGVLLDDLNEIELETDGGHFGTLSFDVRLESTCLSDDQRLHDLLHCPLDNVNHVLQVLRDFDFVAPTEVTKFLSEIIAVLIDMTAASIPAAFTTLVHTLHVLSRAELWQALTDGIRGVRTPDTALSLLDPLNNSLQKLSTTSWDEAQAILNALPWILQVVAKSPDVAACVRVITAVPEMIISLAAHGELTGLRVLAMRAFAASIEGFVRVLGAADVANRTAAFLRVCPSGSGAEREELAFALARVIRSSIFSPKDRVDPTKQAPSTRVLLNDVVIDRLLEFMPDSPHAVRLLRELVTATPMSNTGYLVQLAQSVADIAADHVPLDVDCWLPLQCVPYVPRPYGYVRGSRPTDLPLPPIEADSDSMFSLCVTTLYQFIYYASEEHLRPFLSPANMKLLARLLLYSPFNTLWFEMHVLAAQASERAIMMADDAAVEKIELMLALIHHPLHNGSIDGSAPKVELYQARFKLTPLQIIQRLCLRAEGLIMRNIALLRPSAVIGASLRLFALPCDPPRALAVHVYTKAIQQAASTAEDLHDACVSTLSALEELYNARLYNQTLATRLQQCLSHVLVDPASPTKAMFAEFTEEVSVLLNHLQYLHTYSDSQTHEDRKTEALVKLLEHLHQSGSYDVLAAKFAGQLSSMHSALGNNAEAALTLLKASENAPWDATRVATIEKALGLFEADSLYEKCIEVLTAFQPRLVSIDPDTMPAAMAGLLERHARWWRMAGADRLFPDFFLVCLWWREEASMQVYKSSKGEHVATFQRRMEGAFEFTMRDHLVSSRDFPTDAMLSDPQKRYLQVVKTDPVLFRDIFSVCDDYSRFRITTAPFVHTGADGTVSFKPLRRMTEGEWGVLKERSMAELDAKSTPTPFDTLPAALSNYHRHNNVRVFRADMLWAKQKELKGHCTNLYKNCRFYICDDSLPSRTRRATVSAVLEIVLTPIQIACTDLEAQASGLDDATRLIRSLAAETEVGRVDAGPAGPLTQKLAGIVTAWVNGGPMTYAKAFMASEHRDDALIGRLDLALTELLRSTRAGLGVHRHQTLGLDGLQGTMELNYIRLAAQILEVRKTFMAECGATGLEAHTEMLRGLVVDAISSFEGCQTLFRYDQAEDTVIELTR